MINFDICRRSWDGQPGRNRLNTIFSRQRFREFIVVGRDNSKWTVLKERADVFVFTAQRDGFDNISNFIIDILIFRR